MNQRFSPPGKKGLQTISGLAHRRALPGDDKKSQMSDVYVMQRANGDVLAFDHHGRFRMPVFHSRRDAMIARSRNGDMLLFKPTLLDAGLFDELVPKGGESEVDVWLVKDPANLKRGHLVEHAQLAQLMCTPSELEVAHN